MISSVYPESPSITFIQKIFIIVIFSEHNSNHTATTVKNQAFHDTLTPYKYMQMHSQNRNSHSPLFHLILSVRSVAVF